MNERTSHTLVLRLRLDRDCLRGSVTAESGIRHEFAGRLGLLGAIDDLLTPAAETRQTPPPAAPIAKEPS